MLCWVVTKVVIPIGLIWIGLTDFLGCTYSIGKPLIEQTQNVAMEKLNNKTPQQKSRNANWDIQLILDCLTDGNSNLSQNSSCLVIQATDKVVVQPHLDFQECRERELKFTAAGWKHDCQGKWFRDENVSQFFFFFFFGIVLDTTCWY